MLALKPLLSKTLSEDEGNWFYNAFFYNKGYKQYHIEPEIEKNLARTGFLYHRWSYFNYEHLCCLIFRFSKNRNPEFFNRIKYFWYILTTLSVLVLTQTLFSNLIISSLSSFLFLLYLSSPKSFSRLTYGEINIILPLNISYVLLIWGIDNESSLIIFLAGILLGLAYQIKIVVLPHLFFQLLILLFCCFNQSLYFLSGFIVLNLLPLLFIRGSYPAKSYFYWMFNGYIFMLIKEKVKKLFNKKKTNNGENDETYVALRRESLRKDLFMNFKKTFNNLRSFTYLYLILSIVFLVKIPFELKYFLLLIVLVINFFILFVQKTFYTPKFILILYPLTIMASYGVYKIFQSDLVAIIFLVLILIYFLSDIFFDLYKQLKGIEILGKPEFERFTIVKKAGNIIKTIVKEGESFYCWGRFPSLYLYADRAAIHATFILTYILKNKIYREQDLFKLLSYRAPKWFFILKFRHDTWQMETIMQKTNIPYILYKTIEVKHKNVVYSFPLYRRDDKVYQNILFERSLVVPQGFTLKDMLIKDLKEQNFSSNEIKSILGLISKTKLNIVVENMIFQEIKRIKPDNPNVIETENLLNIGPKNIDEKIAYLKEQSEKCNIERKIILMRMTGEFYKEKNDFENAKNCFLQALKVVNEESDEYLIYIRLAEIAMEEGDLNLAFDYLLKATNKNPYSSLCYNELGIIACLKNDFVKAKDFFSSAVNLNPGFEIASLNLKDLKL